MADAFKRFVRDERAQGVLEYALIVAFIAVVCIVGVRQVGTGTRNFYSNISTSTNAIGN